MGPAKTPAHLRSTKAGVQGVLLFGLLLAYHEKDCRAGVHAPPCFQTSFRSRAGTRQKIIPAFQPENIAPE